MDAETFVNNWRRTLPRPTVDTAYSAGFDCEMNGASTRNCSFDLFSSVELTRAWEAGVREAKRVKANK